LAILAQNIGDFDSKYWRFRIKMYVILAQNIGDFDKKMLVVVYSKYQKALFSKKWQKVVKIIKTVILTLTLK
jgi:hypothetical protein